MKVPYSWLKELVDITVSPQQLSHDLASIGLEVETIDQCEVPKGIVVADVVSVEKHPDADKLSVCQVSIGAGDPLTIVCGAPNVTAGMKAPLAKIGCAIAADFTVKKAKLRGVESSGMLCSERELGISDDHSGIMSLPVNYETGKELNVYFPAESVLDVELTPNRGDCLSILGVAREVSAKYRLPLKTPGGAPRESGDTIADHISVEIQNPDACPRYMGRFVTGVEIKESPTWLKQRLRACGIRSINNIVDITNYILLLFGQPMHAFDYRQIVEKKIIVKNAAEGETFVTLDDVERALCADDLLICDGERAVALAGVMGGANSEIAQDTTDVFLECAFFDPIGIRKTSKRLDLSSDSSYRFERGVDPGEGLERALDTAAKMIRELAGGTVVPGTVDQYPKKIKRNEIGIRPAQASRLLGVTVNKDTIVNMLKSLNIDFVKEDGDALVFRIPNYRHDLELEVDLIEEIGRLYGYDNIESTVIASVNLGETTNPARNTLNTVRKALAYLGLNETVTSNMTSEKKRNKVTPSIDPVEILNPINPEMAQMRTTLLSSLLDVVSYNLKRRNTNNRLFEIGRTYASMGTNVQPYERTVVAIMLEGDYLPASWLGKAQPATFFTLKAVVQSLAAHCGLGEFTFAAREDASYYDVERAKVSWDNSVNGVCGLVRKDILDAWDIGTKAYYAEIDITDFLASQLPQPSYTPLPKYPAVERDFCFVMSEELTSATVRDEIVSLSDLVETVEAFDVYHGDKVGSGKKSVAFSVRLRAADRTLTDKEAEKVSESILGTMGKKHGATLRA